MMMVEGALQAAMLLSEALVLLLVSQRAGAQRHYVMIKRAVYRQSPEMCSLRSSSCKLSLWCWVLSSPCCCPMPPPATQPIPSPSPTHPHFLKPLCARHSKQYHVYMLVVPGSTCMHVCEHAALASAVLATRGCGTRDSGWPGAKKCTQQQASERLRKTPARTHARRRGSTRCEWQNCRWRCMRHWTL